MAKSPPPGKCIHCLKHFETLTWDHIIPVAWYPTTTQPNLEKWKIPSCTACNKAYGEIEEELLIKLGLCLDPKEEKSKGIVQKALRALNQKYAKNERDKKMRSAKRTKILRDALFGDNIPKNGRYPGFDKPIGKDSTKKMAILVNHDHIQKIAEKIVKGITYLEKGEFIESPCSIEFIASSDEHAEHIYELLKKHGTIIERPPGIYINKAVAVDDNMSSIFYIEIWGRWKIFAFTENATHE